MLFPPDRVDAQKVKTRSDFSLNDISCVVLFVGLLITAVPGDT